MSAFLLEWGRAAWLVVAESGPYLLVGFFVAGLLHAFVPEERVWRHMGRDDFSSVLFASLAGAPLPLCSCSVVPAAVALKKAGASRGATTAFLIATPETGLDSIGVTWALMDPLMTVIRPIAAVLTALVSGTLVNRFVRGEIPPAEPASPALDEACGCPEDDACANTAPPAARSRLREAARYAFGPLMADLTPWFLLGFTLSGLIVVLVPDGFFRDLDLPRSLAMLAMLAVGIPMYICATASTPVAAALVAKGLDPGAALVLLLAGPATNVATWLVVRSFLGPRVLAIYLASIAGCSVVFGYATDFLYALLEIAPRTNVTASPEAVPDLFGLKGIAGIVLLAMMLHHAVRDRLDRRLGERLRAWGAPIGVDPTSRAARLLVVLALLAAWASSSVGVVERGATGFVLRFGGVAREVEGPDVVVHWPWPIERLETVERLRVRQLDVGLDLGEPDARVRDLAAEAEVLAGNENLMRVTWTVHWRVGEPRAYRFALAQSERLLRAFSEAALRRVFAAHSSDELLVADRDRIGETIRGELARELKSVGAGIEPVRVHLLDVHAPPQTHFAYRDVASQMEYAHRARLEAEGERLRILAEARAAAYERTSTAEGEALGRRALAEGSARAFAALAGVWSQFGRAVAFELERRAWERGLQQAGRVVALLHPGARVAFLPVGTSPAVPTSDASMPKAERGER